MEFCAYKNCFAKSGDNLKFFAFPSDSRKIEWLRNCGISDCSRRSRICEKHFNKDDIIPSTLKCILKKNAVPLVFVDKCVPVQSNLIGGENDQTKKERKELAEKVFLFESPPSEQKTEKYKSVSKLKKRNFIKKKKLVNALELNRDGGKTYLETNFSTPECTARMIGNEMHIVTPPKNDEHRAKISFSDELKEHVPVYHPRNKKTKLSDTGKSIHL